MRFLFQILLGGILLFFSVDFNAQIITSEPPLPLANQAVTIYFDATKGTAGLKDYTGDVYAHTGVLTNNSTVNTDWKYVKTDWGVNTPETKMIRVSTNLYSLGITPTIRDYYGVPVSETITHMAFVFRSADSSREGKDDEGKDIFIKVINEEFTVSIIHPDNNLIVSPGDTIQFEAASTMESTLSLFEDGTLVKSVTGTTITHSFVMNSAGDCCIKVTASAEAVTKADSLNICVMGSQVEQPLPEGLLDGINYIDDQTVQLVLYAPGKSHVFVIGDFNDWMPQADARMIKDGSRFWITLNDLIPGEEYAFQYLVNGSLTIADPYSEKILDPWHDQWISEETYPQLKAYPSGQASGITSVLQTARTKYTWKNSSFTSPKSKDLVIYELLVRDFIESHNWQTLIDTLDYFTRLGINAIELMPVNEFEGNESWGYNPSFYFAPDKYYGPSDDLKAFIDACHSRGIAVIIDMVLNHSYGQSPLVQLYYDNSAGKVSSENPWYNRDSPNPVYSWGYDFDHESQQTKDFVDRVNSYWIEEFHVDGFRFDFTKGFTNTPGDGSAYDASRIAILKRMADKIWATHENVFIILEHLAANTEERELANYGILLWGNHNYNYNEATMGYHEDGKSDFSWISYKTRGWADPKLVGYMESHDEERLMYKNLNYGNSSGDYHIQSIQTALEKMELAGAFFFTIPGPKMIWQFGELGYDYSIDYDCRTCNKPIRWDYLQEGPRKRIYQVWSALIYLKISEPAFETNDFTLNVSGAVKTLQINDPDMDVRIVGNFDVTRQSSDPSFSQTGWWYNYLTGDSIEVTNVHDLVILEPGEFRIYTTKRLKKPEISTSVPKYGANPGIFHVSPNPVSEMLFMNPVDDAAQIIIFNTLGSVMMKTEMAPGQDNLDLTSLPEGLYIIGRQVGSRPRLYVKIFKE